MKDSIDRNLVQGLIDVIYVHEDKNIEIKFKYNNLYEDALWYLNN